MHLVQVRTCVYLTTGTQLHQAVFGLLHSSFESEKGYPVLNLLTLLQDNHLPSRRFVCRSFNCQTFPELKHQEDVVRFLGGERVVT